MQIINSSTGNVSNILSSSESEKPTDAAKKYLDSNLIKNMSPSHDSTYNSTVEETILLSTNAPKLRQITGHSTIPTASPIVSPYYPTNCQDVRSDNMVLIPTPSTLEQYRLQLYNYALSIDRLRCPQYTAATTMAAESYASGASGGLQLLVNTEKNNNPFGSIEVETESNYASSIPNVRGRRSYTPAAITHDNHLALSMSLFPQRIFHSEEPKPQYSYIGLIAMAILSSPEAKLVLSDIYQYILDHYPYFRARGPGWRNSIRHNLSLNDCFIKSGRSANGKGHYWAIHPANIDDFRKGDFRRRKAQRKVRKHMGLSLDDAGTDSPSPPPLDLTSPPLTSARLLRLTPTGNNLTAGQEFVMAPTSHSFGCLQQKNYPILQVPTSLVSLQAQQMQDSYFSAAIMEQYTCIPSAAYNSRHSASFQQQPQQEHYRGSNDSQQYGQSHDTTLHFLSQQSIGDVQKQSKLIYANQTATTIAPNSAATAIANLYSQTRKRQFDVASLLAPDRTDFVHKIPATDRRTPVSVEEITPLQHTLIKNGTHENGKERNQQQQQDATAQASSLHTSQSLLDRPTLISNAITNPQRLLTLDEQDQDEIDVVANDIEEQTKQAFTVRDKNDADDSYDVIEEDEEEEHTFIADSTIDSSSSIAQIYNDGESECIINATLHSTPISAQQQLSLPGAVVEWHTLQPQQTPQRKNVPHVVVSPLNSQRYHQECYAAKNIATTALTAIETTKTVATPTAADFNSEANSHSNTSHIVMQSLEHNTITPASVTHRNQQVRRLMHHLQQQHQQHDALEKLDDEAQAFGRYYSTYMAAAAARRIGTMQLTHIQRQLSVKHPQLQQQKQKEAANNNEKLWH